MKYNQHQLKKVHVQQLGEFACGLACLSAVTNYYDGPISQEKLREISGTTLNGTTLLGLFQASKQIGFEANGYEADIDNLKKLDSPVILHVVMDGNRQHFIVSYGYSDGKFVVGDPAWGITSYSEDELAAIWQSRTLLSLRPTEKFRTSGIDKQSQWEWFKAIIREDLPILSVAALIGTAMAVLGLSTAIFSQKLIDDFLPNRETEKIFVGFAALFVLLVARAALGYIRGIFMVRQGRDLNVRIVKSFIDKIVHLPMAFFKGFSTGDLIARMNDSMRIRSTVALVTGDILINSLVVLISSVYVFTLSMEVGLLSLSSVAVFVLIAWRFHPQILANQKLVMAAHATNESQYIDALTGIATIKSYNRERVYGDRINAVYDAYQTKGFDLAMLGNRFGFFTQLLVGVYITLIFGLGIWYVLEERLQLGELMALISIGGSIIPSLAGLMIANIQIQEAKVAFGRLYEVSFIDNEKQQESIPTPAYALNGDQHKLLAVKELTFRYPGRRPLLNKLDLEFTAAETVSLFGEIGSGKSTLVDILQGFYQPEEGTLLLNGQSPAAMGLAQWRKGIAVVSQFEKIFNATVLDNICLSNDLNELEKCVQFLASAGMEPFFAKLPQGYLTLCGEEGAALSGGQKQLVTIARALYKQPALIVLDESTSAMDFDTEREVLQILKRYCMEHTTGLLMVTHRIGLARQADRICLLKNGAIVYAGSHEDLIARENDYARGYQYLTQINALI